MNPLAVITDARAPAERLAAFRAVTGLAALGYLVFRLPVFLELADRPRSAFDGVGVFSTTSAPLPDAVLIAVLATTVLAGIGYTTGRFFRATGPTFAIGMLVLTSYHGSWGQLLHFENLIVLHLLIVACSPAADAWSLDARRNPALRRHDDEHTSYGWPLALAGLVVVVSYVISGIAKLRYGGPEWFLGDTLRNHIAYSAARLELLGATPSPLAQHVIGHDWALRPMAAASVAIELAAPVAFLGGRRRDIWVAAVWTMHAAILALMLVGFPYPLFGLAFMPFYRLERVAERRSSWLRNDESPGRRDADQDFQLSG